MQERPLGTVTLCTVSIQTLATLYSLASVKAYCPSPKADMKITRPWHLSGAQNTNHSLFYTLSTVNTLHSFHPKPT